MLYIIQYNNIFISPSVFYKNITPIIPNCNVLRFWHLYPSSCQYYVYPGFVRIYIKHGSIQSIAICFYKANICKRTIRYTRAEITNSFTRVLVYTHWYNMASIKAIRFPIKLLLLSHARFSVLILPSSNTISFLLIIL